MGAALPVVRIVCFKDSLLWSLFNTLDGIITDVNRKLPVKYTVEKPSPVIPQLMFHESIVDLSKSYNYIE